MKNVYENILETVGNTPIVRLQRIGSQTPHRIYGKFEAMNPGHSIKDRIAITLIEDAVESGKLAPGGTIVETTSGNTGMGLAMVAAVKGFKCIFTMPDKISTEKVRALEAFGAKVVTTPTEVAPDDPRSYYSVARKLAEETPNSFFVNQYDNPSNPRAHYVSTGPEIWEQMGDELDVLVAGVGTGGTLCGTAKYLKEKNPSLKAIGIDPVGSVFYDYFKTGKKIEAMTSYLVEGFGEDFYPTTVDFDIIDDMFQVTDQECFDMAKRITKEEGMFVGGSCGGAMVGALKYLETLEEPKTILVIFPDSGSRYLSKIYEPEWMKAKGFA